MKHQLRITCINCLRNSVERSKGTSEQVSIRVRKGQANAPPFIHNTSLGPLAFALSVA